MTAKFKPLLKLSLLGTLLVLLSGCGEGLGDLRQFVETFARSRRAASNPSRSFSPTRISSIPLTTCAILSSWSISDALR